MFADSGVELVRMGPSAILGPWPHSWISARKCNAKNDSGGFSDGEVRVERCRQSCMRVFLLAMIVNLSGPALADGQCPLDRTVFKDTAAGREFVAQRVAVDYQYLCSQSGSDRHYSVPQKNLGQDCEGPFGETIIEGLLDGKKAYVIYNVTKANPCCAWYSYLENDQEVPVKVKEWLSPVEVPVITLGDEWYTIESPDPPFPPDQGPMAGGHFAPTNCRSG